MKTEKEIDHRGTSNVVCPHCGVEESDSWERKDSSDYDECGRCGGAFEWERVTTVEYFTEKIERSEKA